MCASQYQYNGLIRVSYNRLEIKVSTRWQLVWVQACYTVCLMVCQRKRIVYNSRDCQRLGCFFKLCRTTKYPGCDSRLRTSVGLLTAVGYPYSVIAAQPQDTKHWEKQGAEVNDIQGIFCTNILRDYYCKANLSFSVSFSLFSFS